MLFHHPLLVKLGLIPFNSNPDMSLLSGRWIKDASSSETHKYSKQLDLFQLDGLQKYAALKLLKGLSINGDKSGGPKAFSARSTCVTKRSS
jgi:hypothetical protein